MENGFLEYYGDHNISPVRQNINDIEIHYERRKKLYRQCGIPVMTFRNAKMLEVGPGSGYNTLAFFHWNCRHIDLIEANPRGREDMEKLFAEYAIPKDKYKVFPCKIEDYSGDEKYDIIIAEGFLPNIYNQQEIINKLKDLVTENGIIVITCSDDVSFFIEKIKRLMGGAFTKDLPDYEQKVEYLTNLFAPQLLKLRGVSRRPEDWVRDQILNPVGINGTEMSISQAIDYFGDEFDVLGGSPAMFTDYSWYKDIWYDYKEDYRKQFAQKRLSLMMANMAEIALPIEQVEIAAEKLKKITKLVSEYEMSLDIGNIKGIAEITASMKELVHQNFDVSFVRVFDEIQEILLNIQNEKKINMEEYPNFFAAFGRTQQYISFIKR